MLLRIAQASALARAGKLTRHKLLYVRGVQGMGFSSQSDGSGSDEQPDKGVSEASEHVKPSNSHEEEVIEEVPEVEQVEMWNKDAPAGPEWNGPRGYEPTRYGDWSKNGRVSDF